MSVDEFFDAQYLVRNLASLFGIPAHRLKVPKIVAGSVQTEIEVLAEQPCDGHVCGEHGRCQDDTGAALCVCDAGYESPSDCEAGDCVCSRQSCAQVRVRARIRIRVGLGLGRVTLTLTPTITLTLTVPLPLPLLLPPRLRRRQTRPRSVLWIRSATATPAVRARVRVRARPDPKPLTPNSIILTVTWPLALTLALTRRELLRHPSAARPTGAYPYP